MSARVVGGLGSRVFQPELPSRTVSRHALSKKGKNQNNRTASDCCVSSRTIGPELERELRADVNFSILNLRGFRDPRSGLRFAVLWEARFW